MVERPKIFLILILIIFLLTPLTLSAYQIVGPKEKNIETIAKEFVSLLVNKDFLSAARAFNASMSKALPPKELQQTWADLIKQVGQYKKHLSTRKQKISQYDVVFITCQFEQSTLDVKIVLDDSRKIAGLFFLPSQYTNTYHSPPYAESDLYREREVSVGEGKWSLPGTITLPHGKGPYPAVILIHGTGPHDRDETIGPNKPFRDLAWGLASKGTAVLRYEKRTKHHAGLFMKMKYGFTVEEETIADALAAVALLQNISEINKKGIFILGHSLGGMLIPRMGQRNDQIAGFIIMAGPSRPMEDAIYEQFNYIFSLDNQLTEDEKKQLKQLEKQIHLIKGNKLSKDTPSAMLPLGIPANYWIDLKNYDPTKEAAKLAMPLLILQGGRDYQVTLADYKKWKDSLSLKKNVMFKLYPTLNHIFMHGQSKSMPSEYEKPGHVYETIIEDISEWIQKQKTKDS